MAKKRTEAAPKEAPYMNEVVLGDCVELLKRMPEESVDLVFADPPYNLQLQGDLYRPDQSKVDGVDDHWDKFESLKQYDEFSKAWLSECMRVLKPNGTIWTIGSYHNIYRLGYIMQDLGYWILNDVVWVKANPMPNFLGTRFNNSHETLLWASKSKDAKYVFNYHSMKASNDDVQMRSDWHIPLCTGAERLKDAGKKVHSTQKPEALLQRVILSASNPGDLVLDPFSGTGTTAAVAKRFGRRYVGFERELTYFDASKKRLEQVVELPKSFATSHLDRPKPRVSVEALIAAKYLKVGQSIYSKDKTYGATLMADGSVVCNGEAGTIHSVSAKLLGKKANNGWDYWYGVVDGVFIPIDLLRYRYESEVLGQSRSVDLFQLQEA